MIGPTISASGTTQILVATKPVDFRKQADSLAALAQEALGAAPFCGRRLRVPLQEDGPGEAVVVGRHRSLSYVEAPGRRPVPLYASGEGHR